MHYIKQAKSPRSLLHSKEEIHVNGSLVNHNIFTQTHEDVTAEKHCFRKYQVFKGNTKYTRELL